MANASNNGLTGALAWILDSVEIIHAFIKWEAIVQLELPKSLVSDGNVPYSAIVNQIFEKLRTIQNAVSRRCLGDAEQKNVQRVDGRKEDPKDISRDIPVELKWVSEALDSILQVTCGGSAINTEVPDIPGGLATRKPHTAKQLNKIRKRCNIIIVKYSSFQPKGIKSTRVIESVTCSHDAIKRENMIREEASDQTDSSGKQTISSEPKGKTLQESEDDSVPLAKRQMENEVVTLQENVEKLQKEIRSLTEERDKLRIDIGNSERKNPSGAATKTTKQIEDLQNKVSTLTEQRDKYAKEIYALQTRLSETLGARLETNNPNIADLSDTLRPTVIAEHFMQLYDNEWTDGFQTLSNRGLSEREIIQKLFDILQSCYIFCCKLSEEQIKKVLNALIAFESKKSYNTSQSSPKGEADLDVMARRSLHELRRKTGLFSKETAINEYCGQGMYQTTDQDLLPFIERCAELCWYMVLQAPPVYMDPCDSFKQGSDFNKDLFKFYSRSGKQFDFPAWPPLYLHREGPLLAKGVAEPLA